MLKCLLSPLVMMMSAMPYNSFINTILVLKGLLNAVERMRVVFYVEHG